MFKNAARRIIHDFNTSAQFGAVTRTVEVRTCFLVFFCFYLDPLFTQHIHHPPPPPPPALSACPSPRPPSEPLPDKQMLREKDESSGDVTDYLFPYF